MSYSDFDKRMKSYEVKYSLNRKEPVIIRIDGKAFHTFTKHFQKPYDPILKECMEHTTAWLCQNIQGCVLGYTQSDEISLLLSDFTNLETNCWFGYDMSKLCSISASMTTKKFNQLLRSYANNIGNYTVGNIKNYTHRIDNPDEAEFDARAFSLPLDEVANYFYWRQADAIRNSIQMIGRFYFSQKQLNYVGCDGIIKKLKEEKNIDYHKDVPNHYKNGTCVVKKKATNQNDPVKYNWTIDKNIPIFVGEGRAYIEDTCKPNDDLLNIYNLALYIMYRFEKERKLITGLLLQQIIFYVQAEFLTNLGENIFNQKSILMNEYGIQYQTVEAFARTKAIPTRTLHNIYPEEERYINIVREYTDDLKVSIVDQVIAQTFVGYTTFDDTTYKLVNNNKLWEHYFLECGKTSVDIEEAKQFMVDNM